MQYTIIRHTIYLYVRSSTAACGGRWPPTPGASSSGGRRGAHIYMCIYIYIHIIHTYVIYTYMYICIYTHYNYSYMLHRHTCKYMYGWRADPLRGSSVNIGTTQRTLAWPLRKDEKRTSRSVNICLPLVDTPPASGSQGTPPADARRAAPSGVRGLAGMLIHGNNSTSIHSF